MDSTVSPHGSRRISSDLPESRLAEDGTEKI